MPDRTNASTLVFGFQALARISRRALPEITARIGSGSLKRPRASACDPRSLRFLATP